MLLLMTFHSSPLHCWLCDFPGMGSRSNKVIFHTDSSHAIHAQKEKPVLTNASETLGQSSPQLFHFADFLCRLSSWHQIAHRG